MADRALVAFALGVLVAAGCEKHEVPGEPTPVPTPVRATDILRATYRPPADGRLTPKQVELYLAVQERLRPKEGGTPTGLIPEDVVVARDTGFNAEEYLWVKERVLEAEAATLAAGQNARVLAMLERTLADLKARRASAADEGSKKLLSEQISAFEADAERTRREAREKEPDAVRANMKTLGPYRARLAALSVAAPPVAEPPRGSAPARPRS